MASTSDVENAQEHFSQQQKFDLFIFVHLFGDGVFFTAGTFHSIELLGRRASKKNLLPFPVLKPGRTRCWMTIRNQLPLRTSGHGSWKKMLLSMIHGASGIKCVKAMIDKTKATSVNETLAFIACNHCELARSLTA